jgi:hypothetical protein
MSSEDAFYHPEIISGFAINHSLETPCYHLLGIECSPDSELYRFDFTVAAPYIGKPQRKYLPRNLEQIGEKGQENRGLVKRGQEKYHQFIAALEDKTNRNNFEKKELKPALTFSFFYDPSTGIIQDQTISATQARLRYNTSFHDVQATLDNKSGHLEFSAWQKLISQQFPDFNMKDGGWYVQGLLEKTIALVNQNVTQRAFKDNIAMLAQTGIYGLVEAGKEANASRFTSSTEILEELRQHASSFTVPITNSFNHAALTNRALLEFYLRQKQDYLSPNETLGVALLCNHASLNINNTDRNQKPEGLIHV